MTEKCYDLIQFKRCKIVNVECNIETDCKECADYTVWKKSKMSIEEYIRKIDEIPEP